MTIDMYEKAIALVQDWKQIDDKINRFIASVERGDGKYAFDIYFDQEIESWIITTEMCSVGGCTLSGIIVKSKEAAQRKAALKTILGEEMSIGRACLSCYSMLNNM